MLEYINFMSAFNDKVTGIIIHFYWNLDQYLKMKVWSNVCLTHLDRFLYYRWSILSQTASLRYLIESKEKKNYFKEFLFGSLSVEFVFWKSILYIWCWRNTSMIYCSYLWSFRYFAWQTPINMSLVCIWEPILSSTIDFICYLTKHQSGT